MTNFALETLIGDIKDIVNRLEEVDGRQRTQPEYELSEDDGLEVGNLLLELEQLIY